MEMLTAYTEALEQVLSPSPVDLRERVRTHYEGIVVGRENQFVLFGTGELGRVTLRGLRALNIEPLAFCDNNPQLHGKEVQGVAVLSPDEAVHRFRESAIFVPTVFTSDPLRKQMESLGLRILSVPELFWQYPDAFLPFASLGLPEEILDHKEGVQRGLALWHDEASLREYLAQIAWRTTLDSQVLPGHLAQKEIYFPTDLLDLSPDESFVDCGAFDGDSLRAFLTRAKTLKCFIGIEPDSRNRANLQARIEALPSPLRERCSTLPYAVSDRTGVLHFDETGTAGSTLTKEGHLEIPTERLDVMLDGLAPTFIKMDIEGAEKMALEGGRNVIAKHLPVLAICLYHRPSDLWEIPALIRDIAPEYRLFLRRYCDDCWEQVCYAIPPARLKV